MAMCTRCGNDADQTSEITSEDGTVVRPRMCLACASNWEAAKAAAARAALEKRSGLDLPPPKRIPSRPLSDRVYCATGDIHTRIDERQPAVALLDGWWRCASCLDQVKKGKISFDADGRLVG